MICTKADFGLCNLCLSIASDILLTLQERLQIRIFLNFFFFFTTQLHAQAAWWSQVVNPQQYQQANWQPQIKNTHQKWRPNSVIRQDSHLPIPPPPSSSSSSSLDDNNNSKSEVNPPYQLVPSKVLLKQQQDLQTIQSGKSAVLNGPPNYGTVPVEQLRQINHQQSSPSISGPPNYGIIPVEQLRQINHQQSTPPSISVPLNYGIIPVEQLRQLNHLQSTPSSISGPPNYGIIPVELRQLNHQHSTTLSISGPLRQINHQQSTPPSISGPPNYGTVPVEQLRQLNQLLISPQTSKEEEDENMYSVIPLPQLKKLTASTFDSSVVYNQLVKDGAPKIEMSSASTDNSFIGNTIQSQPASKLKQITNDEDSGIKQQDNSHASEHYSSLPASILKNVDQQGNGQTHTLQNSKIVGWETSPKLQTEENFEQ